MSRAPSTGGLVPGSGEAAGQDWAEGTHAKRTSYAVFGWSSSSGVSADGSGSPAAGSPAVWPTTVTPEPVPGAEAVTEAAVTVSGPVTVQPRAETLVTLKLPYTLPSASGALAAPCTPSCSALHPGSPGAAVGGIGPVPAEAPAEAPAVAGPAAAPPVGDPPYSGSGCTPAPPVSTPLPAASADLDGEPEPFWCGSEVLPPPVAGSSPCPAMAEWSAAPPSPPVMCRCRAAGIAVPASSTAAAAPTRAWRLRVLRTGTAYRSRSSAPSEGSRLSTAPRSRFRSACSSPAPPGGVWSSIMTAQPPSPPAARQCPAIRTP